MKFSHIVFPLFATAVLGCQTPKQESTPSDTTATPTKSPSANDRSAHPKDQLVGDILFRYPDSQTVQYLYRILAIKDSLNKDLESVENPNTGGQPNIEPPRYSQILYDLPSWLHHIPEGAKQWYMIDGDELDSNKLFIVNLGTCEEEAVAKREAIFFGDSIVAEKDDNCNNRLFFFGESQFPYQTKIGMSQEEVLDHAKPDTWFRFAGKDSSSILSASKIFIRGQLALFDKEHRLIGWSY